MAMEIEKERRAKRGWDKWELGLLAAALLFYLFFPLYDGPVWCKDSMSYATMDITREPLYPTFLWVFRRLYGEGDYLMPVVVAQSILAAYAAWKLAVTVKDLIFDCLGFPIRSNYPLPLCGSQKFGLYG